MAPFVFVTIKDTLLQKISLLLRLSFSAAKPSDQRLLDVVLVVLVGVWGPFQSPIYSFLGCQKGKLFLKFHTKFFPLHTPFEKVLPITLLFSESLPLYKPLQ